MDDSVSAFIVGTCRTLRKSNTKIYKSVSFKVSENTEVHYIECGSCAELFIQPLQSCFGDVDYLMVTSYFLVFIDEKGVLPYDFRHIAHPKDCLLIEPYHDYPNFVRFRFFGQMSYDWEQKTLKFVHANTRKFLNYDLDEYHTGLASFIRVGPAIRGTFYRIGSKSVDIVASMWCSQWPNVAEEWKNRRRKYGWPTTAIIHEVVQNGCHVVKATHPSCRNDRQQLRLSFSVAEVILLQSWTKIQQIVYHMLKFFAKRELIIKSECPNEDKVLCSYHCKTLMLWFCEQMPPDLWILLSVIEICCSLLQKLVVLLKQKRCPNYFIPQANLFHEHFNRKIVDETAERITYFCDYDCLSLWFVENYIRPVFPEIVNARGIHDVQICIDNYLLHTCEEMKASEAASFDFYFWSRFALEDHDARHVAMGSTRHSNFNKYMLRCASIFGDTNHFQPAADFESCCCFYASVLRILHAVHVLDYKEMDSDSECFVDIISQFSFKPKVLRSKHHNFPKPSATIVSRSQLLFLEAQDLMENLPGSPDCPEFKLLSQVSSSLLRKALECEVSKTSTLTMAILAYMGGLHFAVSEYEAAEDICSRIIRNQTSDQENKELLNAGCLLYIEDIAKINGFYLIFRQIKFNLNYSKKWMLFDLRLSPEVFARYLTILSIKRIASALGLGHSIQDSTLPLDAILMTLAKRKISGDLKNLNVISRVYQRSDPINNMRVLNESSKPNEENIVQLLMEISVENMTAFYDAISQNFGIGLRYNTAQCYRAA